MSPADTSGLRERVEKALPDSSSTSAPCCPGSTRLSRGGRTRSRGSCWAGGKRLRPAFAYWGFRGAGGADSDESSAAVAALEFVQASALIHDDVMDASDTRRGEPAVHRRFERMHADHGWDGDAAAFGAGAAILLGDLCLVWSDELLRRSGIDVGRARCAPDRSST